MTLNKKYPEAWTLLEGIRVKAMEIDALRERARRLRARASRISASYGAHISGGPLDREELLAEALDADECASRVEKQLKDQTERALKLLSRLPCSVDALALKLMYLNGYDAPQLRSALCMSKTSMYRRLTRGFERLEALLAEEGSRERTA